MLVGVLGGATIFIMGILIASNGFRRQLGGLGGVGIGGACCVGGEEAVGGG